MRRIALTGLLAAGVLLAEAAAARAAEPTRARPAAPPSLFTAFRSLCLDTGGDPAGALAGAKAQGWTEPAAADRLPLGDLAMGDAQQRDRAVAGGRFRLAVGRAEDPAGLNLHGAPWRVCIVGGEPADPAAGSAFQSWARVPGMRDADPDAGAATFVIADPQTPGRRSAEGLSDAELQQLVTARRVVVGAVKTIGPLTLLLYAAPVP